MRCNKQKMINLLVLVTVFIVAISPMSWSQIRKKTDASKWNEQIGWLKENAVLIRSIDPKEDDFSDLMPLVKKIGNARIVMLGEQSHQDGTTFLAKCRLIRFLHQMMGFDILAWESPLFDCLQMEADLHSDIPLADIIVKGLVRFLYNGQVLPLFEYARSTYGTTRPLKMVGFDCQSRGYTVERYIKVLFDFLDRVDPQLLTEAQREIFQEGFNRLTEGSYKPKTQKYKSFRTVVEELLALLSRKENSFSLVHASREIAFYRQTLKNLLVTEEDWLQYYKELDSKSQMWKGVNIRDKGMAENLIWLAKERYPDRKIIVWAHSFHIMRDGPSIDVIDSSFLRDVMEEEYYNHKGLVPMGQTVYDQLREEIYTIAFLAYQGKVGFPWGDLWDIHVAEEGSLEYFLHKTGQSYMFVDFKGLPEDGTHWLRQRLVAGPISYIPMRANWTRIFDSIIFTDKMFPCTWEGTEYAEVIGEARSGQTRKGFPIENTLGNWITDAMRWKTGAQIGLYNSERIRADISAGPITKGDIFKLSPSYDKLVLFRLTGQQLKDALEYDVEKGQDRIQVSGLKYRFHPKEVKPYGERVDYIEVNGDVLEKEGKVLWPKKIYTVVSTNWIVKHGEDLYLGFPVTDSRDTNLLLYRSLMEWLEEHKILDYKIEERILEITK